MSDYIRFPEEIVCEILKRLSIEDAVRCTSVCKSWYSLITSPSFITFHSQHQIASSYSSTNNKDVLLVRDYYSKNPNRELYALHFIDDNFAKHRAFHFPIRACLKDTYFRVVGCVNGVVCLSDDIRTYTEEIVLWNPSISKFLQLPDPIFSFCTHGGFDHTIGFGFDDEKKDFKVVRVVYLMNEGSMVPPMVEVFEPNVGTWREVDAKGFSHFIDVRGPQVFLHGNVHWVIGCKDDHDFWKQYNETNLIVSFDLKREVFGLIKAPDSLNEHQLKQDYCVSVLGDSLSLIHHTRSENGNACCVWVMKQYGESDSWTKLFNIDVIGGIWQVLGFWRNGEALVKSGSLFRGLKDLVSFEPKSKQVEFLAGFGDWKPLYVNIFEETLFLLGVKGDNVLDNVTVDTKSPAEESCEPEDETRFHGHANPSTPDNVPPIEVKISWFGSTD